MSESAVEADQEPSDRRRWRHGCGIVGWIGMMVALIGAFLIFWRMFGASVGLALGAGGMSASDVDAVRRDAMILAWGTGAIAVLAILGRRWGLLGVAIILLGASVIFLGGHIATR